MTSPSACTPDWTRLLDSAARHGLLLVLSRRVAALPDCSEPQERVTLGLLRDERQPSNIVANLAWRLSTLDSCGDVAATLFKTAFVPGPRDWSASDLPDWLTPAYSVARPIRLLLTYVPRWARTIRVKRRREP